MKAFQSWCFCAWEIAVVVCPSLEQKSPRTIRTSTRQKGKMSSTQPCESLSKDYFDNLLHFWLIFWLLFFNLFSLLFFCLKFGSNLNFWVKGSNLIQFFSNFAQILLKFCSNFAPILPQFCPNFASILP